MGGLVPSPPDYSREMRPTPPLPGQTLYDYIVASSYTTSTCPRTSPCLTIAGEGGRGTPHLRNENLAPKQTALGSFLAVQTNSSPTAASERLADISGLDFGRPGANVRSHRNQSFNPPGFRIFDRRLTAQERKLKTPPRRQGLQRIDAVEHELAFTCAKWVVPHQKSKQRGLLAALIQSHRFCNDPEITIVINTI